MLVESMVHLNIFKLYCGVQNNSIIFAVIVGVPSSDFCVHQKIKKLNNFCLVSYVCDALVIVFCWFFVNRVIVEHARGGPRGDDRRNSYRDYPPPRRSRGGGGRDK